MSAARVVITGMGVVSPNGIGNRAFCGAVLAGRSGVARITRFDPSDLPVQIAGEVRDFDELAWIDRHERKHVSRAVPMTIAASAEALSDAGLDPAGMSLGGKREIGVLLGSGGGAQEFSEEQYRLWLSGRVKRFRCSAFPAAPWGRWRARSACASGSAARATWSPPAARRPPTRSPTPTAKSSAARCR